MDIMGQGSENRGLRSLPGLPVPRDSPSRQYRCGLRRRVCLSPIDLIPDPIPVLGYLDDILILPFGIALAIKLIPPAVMEDARRRAKEVNTSGRVMSRAGAVLVIGLWLLVALLVTAWAWEFLRR